MAGDIDHVVDASHDPEVAILIFSRTIAREIKAGNLRPVLLLITRIVAVDRAQHRWPRARDDQISALVWADRLSVASHHIDFDSRKWLRARARLRRGGTGQRRDHDRARLSLPPRVDDRTFLFYDNPLILHP